MGNYEVHATDTFKAVYSSLDKNELIWIEKVKQKLRESVTGDILNFSWFREKKHHNKRSYYLIDEESKKILLVAFASKKEQRKMIEFVRENMESLLKHLKEI